MNTNPPLRDSLGHGRDVDGFVDVLEPRDGEESLNLAVHLRTLQRGKWIVLLTLCAGVGLAWAHLSTLVPLYTAAAQVRFITQAQSVANLDTVVSGISSEDEALNTEVMVLNSHALLGRVVDELDLVSDPEFARYAGADGTEAERSRWFEHARVAEMSPARRFAVSKLRSVVDVDVLRNTYVLLISAQTTHPEKSAAIANALADAYVESQLEGKFDATRRATLWLSEQVADLKISLEAAEAAVEDFASSSPLVTEEALQQSATRLERLRDRRRERLSRMEFMAKQLADARTMREIEDFEGAAARLDEPQIRRIADQIEAAGSPEARASLVARFDEVFSRWTSGLETQIAAAERQAATLQQAIAEGDERLKAESAQLIDLRQLQREAEATRLLYAHFLSRMKETSVQEGVQQADSEVLSWALPPTSPSFPDRTSLLARAAALSLILGGVLVFLLEHLNRRFRTPDELEEITGGPVLATIPTAPGSAPLTYIVERPGSAVAEAVRNLRTSVLLSNLDRPPQVILVTSSLPSEGKSTTLLMLAQITAQMGKRTLVIEGDIRRPRFRSYFELEGKDGLFSSVKKRGEEESGPGLLSLLTRQVPIEEGVYRDEATGLDVIFSQKSKVNAADLFSSERFADFIGEMRERYDFVFIDTPPVLLVPDARVLAQVADAVIYAVRWNSTTQDQVKSGLKLFAQSQARVTGLALTRVNPRRIARYGYGGYGYGSGSKYYTN